MSSFLNDDDDLMQQIFYYYSYFTFFITWLLVPFLFYTIQTKSSRLGKFKWLIFNHTIWSLALQSSLALFKPYILLPASAGFQLGILRSFATFKATAFATLMLSGFLMNSILGLVLTLGSRYIGVFDTKLKKYFYTKKCCIFIAVIYVIIHSLLCIIIIPVASLERSTMLQWALEYNPMLTKYFSEPSFIIIPHDVIDIPLIIGITFLTFLYLFFGFIILYFFKQIHSMNKICITKIQTSLIFSSIAQMGLTCFFLFTPLYFFMICIRWNISASTAMALLFCLISTHSIVDFLATLYFVLPYRKFVQNLFYIIMKKNRPNSISNVKQRQRAMSFTLFPSN